MLNSLPVLSKPLKIHRGLVFGVLIVTALIAFEVFNYSSTDFALSDLLGELTFLGINWSTILAIAFCGIDFAGIARLLTPEQNRNEPSEIWYLFGAWMLAAMMNAMLTWWGVSIAILNHETLGNAVVARVTLLKVVPIFVAVMVWLIRVLIIGSISMAGDHFFSQSLSQSSRRTTTSSKASRPSLTPKANRSFRPTNNNSRQSPTSSIKAPSYQSPSRNSSINRRKSTLPVEPEYTPVDTGQPTISFSNNREGNRSDQVRF